MNLVELITYFKNNGSFEEFCKKYSLNSKAEVIEVYMAKPFKLNKELLFFEIERTEGALEYVLNGVTYYNLFDFYYFLDVIADFKEISKTELSENQVASRIFSFAIKDA